MTPKAMEANAITKFRLLMWKNFLQQWRHKYQTAVELFIPVVTMALVLILRWQLEPEVMETVNFTPLPAHTLNQSALVLGAMNNMTTDLSNITWAYSPRSPLLEDVVTTAIAKLLIQNGADLIEIMYPEMIPNLPVNITVIQEILKSLIDVEAYNNSAELKDVYFQEDATQRILTAIEFDDSLAGLGLNDELPLNLSYALRFPERPRLNQFYGVGSRSWRTEFVFPPFELPGPRSSASDGGSGPGYIREMFIAMQHAISSELITRLTNINMMSFDVKMQRFPHPAYVEDLAIEALQILFPMFIMLSFSYTSVNIVRAVTVEKEMQLKESMKIMGLPTSLHWIAWFCKQFVYLFITAVLIVILLKVNWFSNESGYSDYAVFTNTSWSVLLFFVALYLICTIFFCFMVSGFFSRASTAALFTGVIWFLTYIPAFMLSMDVEMSVATQTFTCLAINSAMSYGFQLILAKESTGGLQWGEFMATPSTESSRFVFGQVVIMLVVDCVLYMLIALYLEQVLPGPFGAPKPWYFPLQKDFWFTKQKVDLDTSFDDEQDIVKESDPKDHKIGVKITNLTKVYGPNIAVNNLSLNIYDDQITVLLGHNGAGKSTTISMITGNTEMSAGSVNISGYDMSKQTRQARSLLGLCPQHNVLFNELTVREHLLFFARLKGFTGKELEQEVEMLIKKLELEDKRDYEAHGLSGGQKRRLCVGIALSGDARVVLLDEPTSGMDPSSRRALWDLLQTEKKGRSIILTTHFMDEADILGDRVAIMAHGKLQCLGSPFFLKRHYGVGYTFVVVKKEGFNQELCSEIINKHIPGTVIKEERATEITYNLSNEQSSKFEAMLIELESSIQVIQYKDYGLVATTLEDVFMTVGSDALPGTVDVDDSATTVSDDFLRDDWDASTGELVKEDELSGLRLIWQHIWAIWLKLWLVWSRSWGTLILQLGVPIVLINTNLGIYQYVLSFTESTFNRHLSLSQGYTSTESLVYYNGTASISSGSAASAAYEASFAAANVPNMAITRVEQPLDDYYLLRTSAPGQIGTLRNRLLIGATFDESSVTAWFSNFGYHDVATSLAAVHSAILKSVVPEANLDVYNHPLEAHYRDQNNLQLMISSLSVQLASGIGNSLAIVTAVFVMFYIKERVSRAKLLQKASGVQPAIMWGSAAVFDLLWFLIICCSIAVSCVAFQVVGLSTGIEIARLFLCFIIFGAAMLPFNYLMSNFFKGPAVGFVAVFFINVLFGMMGSQIVEALYSPSLSTQYIAGIMDGILEFFPLYSLITCIRYLNQIGLTEYACLQTCEQVSSWITNIDECTMETMCANYPETCCLNIDSFIDWDKPGIGRFLTCMIITCVVLWNVLMIYEYQIFQKLLSREHPPHPVEENTQDEDVVDEARHALNVDKHRLPEHCLVSIGLSKYYGKHLAVNQVSFTVADGECFGLLGVNGAGKTTTFKMLMGDETVSSGDAFVAGNSVRRDITKVHKNIGYCPQFDAVFPELTGRETLHLFSLLRGLRSINSQKAEALAHALGFAKHIDKRVEQYSGGNKRKLSTAVALLGNTRLVFVDEPTTGVDPAAKRKVWRVLKGACRMGRGAVLTSHSMEECEALCSRLTVMVNGRFTCLGTPQHLKNKFSQGFTLTIKMRIHDDSSQTASSATALETLKNYVEDNFFNSKIMEEYQGLLTYYLPDKKMPWSKMFGVMEVAKRDLDVEDYSISQTTLEQIFLQFTKYQHEISHL